MHHVVFGLYSFTKSTFLAIFVFATFPTKLFCLRHLLIFATHPACPTRTTALPALYLRVLVVARATTTKVWFESYVFCSSTFVLDCEYPPPKTYRQLSVHLLKTWQSATHHKQCRSKIELLHSPPNWKLQVKTIKQLLEQKCWICQILNQYCSEKVSLCTSKQHLKAKHIRSVLSEHQSYPLLQALSLLEFFAWKNKLYT